MEIAEQLSDELPGFWEFFAQRHPRYGSNPPHSMVGMLPVTDIYEAIGDTITAYVRQQHG